MELKGTGVLSTWLFMTFFLSFLPSFLQVGILIFTLLSLILHRSVAEF